MFDNLFRKLEGLIKIIGQHIWFPEAHMVYIHIADIHVLVIFFDGI